MFDSFATADDRFGGWITGRALRAEVRTASARPEELLVAQRPNWLEGAASSLRDLLSLPENWDSYGARPVAISAVVNSFHLLVRLSGIGMPAPRMVPTASGGVQLEWQVNGLELELALEPDGQMLAVFEDVVRNESWERELPPANLLPIADALRRIAQGRHHR